MGQGAETLSATARDAAGNTSAAGTRAITVDTVAPAAPVIAAVATDNLINASEQSASISGTAEANATIALSLGGNIRNVSADGSGNWSYTLIAADLTGMGQGAETLSATARDAAGNTGAAGTRAITVDTVAPAATASITGADDNVPAVPVTNIAPGDTTNDNTPTLKGTLTGSLGAGEVVALYDGATLLGNASVTGTNWSLTTPGLANSAHSFSARVEDAAGNQGTASAAYAFTVDAAVPTATATLTGADDNIAPITGNVASGGSSNDTTLGLSGAIVGTLGAGDIVRIYDGASLLGNANVSGATWSFATAALSEGAHSFTALVENAGGNQGATSGAYAVTVDLTAPTTTVATMQFSADTGTSGSDFITHTAAQTVSGTLSAALAAGEGVQVSLNNGATWATASANVGSDAWSLAGQTLTGSNTLKVKVVDAAGNDGAVASQAYVLDTTAPSLTAFTLAAGSDTGVAGDGISSDTTPTIQFTAEAGAALTINLGAGGGFVAAGTGTGALQTLTAPAYAADGTYSVQLRATDSAGNVSSQSATYTLDTVAPAFSSASVNGATLTLNYNGPLDGANAPLPAAFTVMVNGSPRTVNSVAVSGSSATLTLASAVVGGDTVTVGYTDPTAGDDANALQDVAGNDAASLAAQNVATGPDVTGPVLMSVTVDGDVITLTYNEALDPAHQPAASYYSATVNGNNAGVENVAISGSTVQVTLRSGVSQGDAVTVSYSDPSGGNDVYAIQDLAGNDAASLAGHLVTNSMMGNAATTSFINASFTEAANTDVSLVFNEAMQGNAATGVTLQKNGVGANILTSAAINGATVTFHTSATLGAGDFVTVGYNGSGDLRDLSGNAIGQNTMVIGGSGANAIDLNSLSGLMQTVRVRGNGGADTLNSSNNNDNLSGGGGADTVNGGWGKDTLNLSETTRASDTVVVGTDGGSSSGSQPYFYDTVSAFDVSGTAANDKLNLPSNSIAASTADFVNGSDAGAIKSHSIGAGGMATFGSTDAGTPILINAGNLNNATAYLEQNFAVPAQAMAFQADTDGNGYADSLFVFQNQGGSDIDNDVLIKLTGVNGVSLGTTAGQNVVQLVDTTGPNPNGASFTTGANAVFSLTHSENILVTNTTGITLQKNGTGANIATGVSASGNVLNVQTNATLADTDYVLLSYNGATGTVRDANGNKAGDILPGVALGGSGNTVVDLSALTGDYGIYDPVGDDTLTGTAGNNELNADSGTDTLHGGAGNDYIEGGGGADNLDGGAGADEYSFTQGDSTAVTFNAGAYTFTGGAADLISSGFDVVATGGDSQTADRIHLRSAMPGNGFSLMATPADGLATDQHYFLERGNYSAGVFTNNAGGADTLVVYDGDSNTGTVSQTALVVQGVLPTQLTATSWGDIYLSSAAPDTTPPTSTGASFTNAANSEITINYDEVVTASSPAGLSLSWNPSNTSWNWGSGTPMSLTGVPTGLDTSTIISFPTDTTLSATDVVRAHYDAGPGNLRDLAGNEVASGEVFFGGSGDNIIDLSDYWPQTGFPVTLRGNAGNDILIGTDASDVLVDGGGVDGLYGGHGADTLRLVENGGSIAYSPDVVVLVGVATSTVAAMDHVRGSLTSPIGTGFDITSVTPANHDVLALFAANIAADATNVDGTDSGSLARHSVTSGIVTFLDAGGNAILINSGNAGNAASYLSANFTATGATAAFKIDTDGDGNVDSLRVFQNAGSIPLLGGYVIPDTLIELSSLTGINSATLGTVAAANVVRIADAQAPGPVGFAVTATGFAFDFAENAFATTGLAVTMLKNGVTPMNITGVTDNGTTSLGLVTDQTLLLTDWVLDNYTGTTVADGISDAAGNVLTNDSTTQLGGDAEGRDGDTVIDLSGFAVVNATTHGYSLGGFGGNDTLTGSSGDDWIQGGTGADTMTGGGGIDGFNFEQGDSPAVTAKNLGGDSVLNSGDTFSFTGGVDHITDLASGEGFNLDKPMGDLFGNAGAPGYMGSAPTDGLATDQGYFAVQGNFADGGTPGSSGTFTVNTATGLDTLVVWDGDSSAAATQTGIVLSGVTLADLNLYTGSNWISHI